LFVGIILNKLKADNKSFTTFSKIKENETIEFIESINKRDSVIIKTKKPNIIKANKININKATENELELLPGIGSKTAKSIINYRNNSSKFNNIEELKNIKGIGEKKFDKLKNIITI